MKYHYMNFWGASKPTGKFVMLCGHKSNHAMTANGKRGDDLCRRCVAIASSQGTHNGKFSPIDTRASK